VRRFAMGPGVSCTDAPYIPPGFSKWTGTAQKIIVDPSGVVQSQVDAGSVEILNQPTDINSVGPWDDLAFKVWRNRLAYLYWLPGRVWADKVLVAHSHTFQPVANMSTSTGVKSSITFPLKDPRAQLEVPIQFIKFPGDGTTQGGGADLKGQPIPIIYGTVSNIPGKLTDRALQIYCLCDQPGTPITVRDGNLPLTAGTQRATISDLIANVPPDGAYDWCSNSTQGTWIRLNSEPVFKLGIDVSVGATEADRTHAQVWKAIRLQRAQTLSGNIDAAAVTQADTDDGHEVGFYWDQDGFTIKSALDEVLASFSAFEVKHLTTNKWSIHKLIAPDVDPELTVKLLTPTASFGASDRRLIKIDRVSPSYLPDGTPPWRVTVKWGKNYQVMAAADNAYWAAQRLKEKLAQEWRSEFVEDSAIAALFIMPPEMTVPTGYQPGSDNLTCPHALDEATRIKALYTWTRPGYAVSFRPKINAAGADDIQIGRVWAVDYPQFDLAGGKRFRGLGAQLVVENGQAVANVTLGLQEDL
jgi:hypothetical protein